MNFRSFKLTHSLDYKQRRRFNEVLTHHKLRNHTVSSPEKKYILHGGEQKEGDAPFNRLGKSYTKEELGHHFISKKIYDLALKAPIQTCSAHNPICKALTKKCFPKYCEGEPGNCQDIKSAFDHKLGLYGHCSTVYLTEKEQNAFKLQAHKGTLHYNKAYADARKGVRKKIVEWYKLQNHTISGKLDNTLLGTGLNFDEQQELEGIISLENDYSLEKLKEILDKKRKQIRILSGLMKRNKKIALLEKAISFKEQNEKTYTDPSMHHYFTEPQKQQQYINYDLLHDHDTLLSNNDTNKHKFEYIYAAIKNESQGKPGAAGESGANVVFTSDGISISIVCVRIPREIFSGTFHHSSLVSGGKSSDELIQTANVLCAGNLFFQFGALTKVDNGSGHFKPPQASLNKFYEVMKDTVNNRVNFNNIETPTTPSGSVNINKVFKNPELTFGEELDKELNCYKELDDIVLDENTKLKDNKKQCMTRVLAYCNPTLYNDKSSPLQNLYTTESLTKFDMPGGWRKDADVMLPNIPSGYNVDKWKSLYKKTWPTV